MKKYNSTFKSHGLSCAGTLYVPDNKKKPPVIIMCHGIATERTFGLVNYVEKFMNVGLAVFQFDYRNFGDSEGIPRNLVSPRRHVNDVKAAIAHVKTLGDIDASRMGLWGTSFGGGHVLVAAANNPEIKAVVAQVPFVNGISTLMSFPPCYQLQGLSHGMLDLLAAVAFIKPHYVPVIKNPGAFALMNTPESYPGYSSLIPENSKWENQAPARICLTLPMYMPAWSVGKINCPVFYVYAKKDSLIPYKAVESVVRRTKHASFMLLDCGHFDIYSGPLFEKVAAAQSGFFADTLK